jgi:hypothetical protein
MQLKGLTCLSSSLRQGYQYHCQNPCIIVKIPQEKQVGLCVLLDTDMTENQNMWLEIWTLHLGWVDEIITPRNQISGQTLNKIIWFLYQRPHLALNYTQLWIIIIVKSVLWCTFSIIIASKIPNGVYSFKSHQGECPKVTSFARSFIQSWH